jgi:hypothetical protein
MLSITPAAFNIFSRIFLPVESNSPDQNFEQINAYMENICASSAVP